MTHDQHLDQAREFDDLDYFILTDRVMMALDEDELVAVDEELSDQPEKEIEPYTLCCRCGALEPGAKASLSGDTAP
jgi:hypothetical protein